MFVDLDISQSIQLSILPILYLQVFDHTTGSAVSTWFYLVELAVLVALVVLTWLNFLLFDGTPAHLVKALLLADLLVKLARSCRLASLPHLGVHDVQCAMHMLVIGVTVQCCTKFLPH